MRPTGQVPSEAIRQGAELSVRGKPKSGRAWLAVLVFS